MVVYADDFAVGLGHWQKTLCNLNQSSVVTRVASKPWPVAKKELYEDVVTTFKDTQVSERGTQDVPRIEGTQEVHRRYIGYWINILQVRFYIFKDRCLNETNVKAA